MPIMRRQLPAAERTVNPGSCLLREKGLVMIVMLASSMDFAGGIHEVAIAAMPIDAQAHPNNTIRLLTKAPRLANQNVSRATFWDE